MRNPQMLPILLLERSATAAEPLLAHLAAAHVDCSMERVETKAQFEDTLEHGAFQLIVADYALLGDAALEHAHGRRPTIPILLLFDEPDEPRAAAALALGATDCLPKGQLDRLVPAIARALREVDERAQRHRSEEMLRCLAEVGQLLDTAPPDQPFEAGLRRALPTLGEWAVLELDRPNAMTAQLGCAHVDVGRESLLHGLSGRPVLKAAYERALGTRELMGGGPADLRANGEDDHDHTLAALGLGAFLVAPLVISGRAVGALSFGAAGTDYTACDRVLAREIAARCATLIERARLVEAASESARTQGELMAVLATELRNPLSAVLMSSVLLVKTFVGDAAATRPLAQAETIQRAAERMNRVLADLVDLWQLDGDRLGLARADEDASAMLTEACDSAAPLALERSVRLERAFDLDGVTLECDRDRVLQLLACVLGHSIAHAADGGSVRLAGFCDGDRAVITVSDDGADLTPEQQTVLFARSSGAGLELALARGVAEAHGGALTVDAARTFTLTLPGASGPAPATTAAADANPAA
jgi:signal transduction histidine kinase/CheY-like chemotaxis protein